MAEIDPTGGVVPSPQVTLFDLEPLEWWREYWDGMPEFISDDITPVDTITVQFRTEADKVAFLNFIGEKPCRVKSIWFPKMDYLAQSERVTGCVKVQPNRYPIYVISKGRWKSRLTIRALEKLGLPYHVVVEPQELDEYGSVIDRRLILTLPFSNLGQGSIPARNWVWEHAAGRGSIRHWILDDNIDGFYRLNRNLKTKVVEENPFVALEDFVDRYANVAVAGLNYEFFADRRSKQPPFRLNTRIYSCILIKNDIPFRWRGRYNEDTDLCLRALKAGWCTVLFNAFLCKKMPTMKMEGGNTDELYAEDGRRKMAESLVEQHPDCVTITRKWNRWQHHVDYSSFKRNKLIPAAPYRR